MATPKFNFFGCEECNRFCSLALSMLFMELLVQFVKLLICDGVCQGNGQCRFIWNNFLRNWKFESPPNIVSCNLRTLFTLSRFTYHWPFPLYYLRLLQNNQLSGPIPAEIGNLLELQTLDLSGNQLVGNIPSSLGSLTHLSYLWVWLGN